MHHISNIIMYFLKKTSKLPLNNSNAFFSIYYKYPTRKYKIPDVFEYAKCYLYLYL